jgi:hypothetical protein
MHIFLSYVREDRRIAEAIAYSLRGRYSVFLDVDDLPAGKEHIERIKRAVRKSQIFIFLISPDSIATGRFTLAELQFARQKWKNPDGHVLPVMVRKTQRDNVPEYLRAVTILEPDGPPAAGICAAVDTMRKSWMRPVALVAAGVVAGLLAYFLLSPRPIPCSEERNMRSPTSDIETTIVFANKGKQTIRLFWLDSSGKRIFYPPPLGPNDVASQITYVNHAWLVADNKGTCKAIYVATRQKLEVDVDE